MHVEIAPKVVSSNPVSRRSGPKTCAPTMRGAARGHMCSRVLEARKWSGPGRVGAGCDARVLGLHAAHVHVGGVQEGSAVPRSGQRGRDVGRRHLVFNIRLSHSNHVTKKSVVSATLTGRSVALGRVLWWIRTLHIQIRRQRCEVVQYSAKNDPEPKTLRGGAAGRQVRLRRPT